MLTEHNVNPAIADAYLDGMTAGMWLAETYQDEEYEYTYSTRRLWTLRGVGVVLGLILSAFLWCWLIPHIVYPGNAPASCTIAGHQLPSGDAIKVDAHGGAWTIGSNIRGPVAEYVCTSGAWVPVTGYGL